MTDDVVTDDAKLIDALVRMQRAAPAWAVGREAAVDEASAKDALAPMADHSPEGATDTAYPLMRRGDLVPTCMKRSK